MNKNFAKHLPFMILLLLAITACSSQTETPNQEDTVNNQATSEELEKVSIQMSWIHEYSVAAFHQAAEAGDFAEQGLDITLIEGGFNEEGYIDPIEEVVSGNIEFGMSDASNLIVARSQEKPVVAVMSIMQRSPFALLSLEDSNIVRPQDLVGKTVSISDGGARQVYDSLIQLQNIDSDDIDTISRTSFGIEPLLDGEVDVLGGWIINEGVSITEAEESYNAILMSDYAVDSYSFVLFTSEDYLESNRDTVQKTVNAIIAGLQGVIDNPEQAIDYTLIYNEELDRDAQLRRLNASIPLINVPNIDLGDMDAEVWEIAHQILLDNDVIDEPIALDAIYTTEFVDTDE